MSDQNPPSEPTGSTPPPAEPGPPRPPGSPPYGAPPPPPSEPPPTGQPWGGAPPPPPGPGYGQPPGQGYASPPPYGSPSGWTGPPLAEWSKRVYSYLIDYLAAAIAAGFFYSASRPLGTLLWLAALGWGLYNAWLGGETGQSIGKKQAGIRLLRESDGQPIGGGLGIGRYFLHVLDAIPCYIGFLWPLWDSKKQTFADKILSTIVVDEGARR